MIEYAFFFLFTALTVVPVIFILLSKQILYIAFALMISFFGVAGLYVFAGAEFVAVTQIMIYLGGVLVLLLFGIMFTKRGNTKLLVSENRGVWGGSLLALAIFSGMCWVFGQVSIPTNASAAHAMSSALREDNIRTLGIALMTEHVVAFELAGVLLLAALIGAAFIAGKKTTPTDNGEG